MDRSPERTPIHPPQPEQQPASREARPEMHEAERTERTESGRHEQHEALETARLEAVGLAATNMESPHYTPPVAAAPEPTRVSRGPISRADRDASFNATMDDIRHSMTPGQRAFSKIIHARPIEKASAAAAGTIARPDSILFGAVFAFAFTLGFYLLSKHLGYRMSGVETIVAFIMGWICGIVFDFLKVMITGKK